MVTILYQAKALSDQKECEIGRFKGKHIRVYNLCNKDEKWWKRQVAEFGDKTPKVSKIRKFVCCAPAFPPLCSKVFIHTKLS